MNTYIALFRGINVGGNHLLPMKDLVGILEGIGCEKVRTYIQSGNAVFRARKNTPGKIAEAISANILKSHGFKPNVLLLGVPELEEAVKNNPYKTADGKALHFFFLVSRPAKPDLDGLEAVKSKSEAFRLGKQVFYLYTPDGIGRSRLATRVEKSLGVPVTARNWNTVRKLVEIAKEDPV